MPLTPEIKLIRVYTTMQSTVFCVQIVWKSKHSLFLPNIFKNFTVDNKKRTELNGKYFDFSVSHETINVNGIEDIHKH